MLAIPQSEASVQYAVELLWRYKQGGEQLFGVTFCTIKLHYLIHLAEQTLVAGPLWCTMGWWLERFMSTATKRLKNR